MEENQPIDSREMPSCNFAQINMVARRRGGGSTDGLDLPLWTAWPREERVARSVKDRSPPSAFTRIPRGYSDLLEHAAVSVWTLSPAHVSTGRLRSDRASQAPPREGLRPFLVATRPLEGEDPVVYRDQPSASGFQKLQRHGRSQKQ